MTPIKGNRFITSLMALLAIMGAEAQTASEVHKVTGTFITDFQSVGNRSVVKMKIKGKEFMIYFNEPVPDELQKAQKMLIEVSINIIRSESGKFMFHSTL